MATVSSTVPLSGVSIVPVVIIVTDVNDNDPEFTSNFIPLTVPEVKSFTACSQALGLKFIFRKNSLILMLYLQYSFSHCQLGQTYSR